METASVSDGLSSSAQRGGGAFLGLEKGGCGKKEFFSEREYAKRLVRGISFSFGALSDKTN